MQLLESSARRRRSRAGTAVSILVHATLIGGAAVATASAHAGLEDHAAREKTIFYEPPHDPPPTPVTPRASRSTTPSTSTAAPSVPQAPPLAIGPIVDGIPPIGSMPDPTRGLGDTFVKGLASGAEEGSPGAPMGDAPRDARYVDKVAVPLGQLRPRYPEALRAQGLGGRVVVRFVVDTLGRVEQGSVQLVAATHPAFGDAALRTVGSLRFRPAEAGGHRVRQLVELPFEFRIE